MRASGINGDAADPLPGLAGDTPGGTAYDAQLQGVLRQMMEASDEAALGRAAADIQALARAMAEDVPAQQLTRVISALNDTLTRRVIDLCAASAERAEVAWCWIALGSEGRQEQTIASDQDNGIVFDSAGPADEHRARLITLALRVNQLLADCGFPLCKGRIMASNPQWCLSVQEWRERFHSWLTESDPQALRNATIFFDLRALHGDCALASPLLEWLAQNASDNPRFLFQMAENALRRQPPLGLLRDFAVERDGPFRGTIDLKLQAATLFVDAARVFGLASASPSSNSAERLRHAAAAHLLDRREVEAWVQGFYLIQSLRLKNQRRGAANPNRIDPYGLAAPERRALLEALQQARALQRRMEHVFVDSARGI